MRIAGHEGIDPRRACKSNQVLVPGIGIDGLAPQGGVVDDDAGAADELDEVALAGVIRAETRTFGSRTARGTLLVVHGVQLLAERREEARRDRSG